MLVKSEVETDAKRLPQIFVMTSTWNIICDDNFIKRTCFACDVYKDRYIVIAGGLGELNEDENEFVCLQSAAMYDVVNQSFIALPDLPFAEGICTGVVLNDYFYLTSHYEMELYRIDLFGRVEWKSIVYYGEVENNRIKDMLTDGTRIFLIDECAGIRIFDPRNNEFSPAYPNADANMEDLFQVDENAFSAVLIDNKIYVMGGNTSSHTVTDNTHMFDIFKKSWSQAPPLTIPICFSAAVAIDNRWIVVHGGMEEHDQNKGHTFLFDTYTQQWTHNNINAAYRTYHSCVQVGSQIITIGGEDHYHERCPMTSKYINGVITEWDMLKPYILLRKLVDNKRAAPIIIHRLKHADSILKVGANAEAVVQNLFTNMSLDIFQYVLLYLKH